MNFRFRLTHASTAFLVAASIASNAGAQTANGSSKSSAKAASKAKLVPAAPVKFVTAPDGNSARYRVREQLVGKDLPNDAIGNTGGVTGAIAIGADGKLVGGDSKFVVDLTPLKSDQDRRDRFVQSRLLETTTFPTTTLVLTAVQGLASPLPTSGTTKFQLVGDLTVKGVTKPTTWNVTATVDGDNLKGTAITGFTFADFSITQPKVPILLSVADSIHLEYDFNLVKQKTP